MHNGKIVLLSVILMFFADYMYPQKTPHHKHRIFVLTDISTLNNIVGEPDDTQSMIRLLLYANEFKIEGIAATYTSHNKTIYPDYIREIIKAYGKSWKNLKRYGNFPSDKYLLKRVFSGNKSIGVNQIGEGKDTEASERIIELLKNNS